MIQLKLREITQPFEIDADKWTFAQYKTGDNGSSGINTTVLYGEEVCVFRKDATVVFVAPMREIVYFWINRYEHEDE